MVHESLLNSAGTPSEIMLSSFLVNLTGESAARQIKKNKSWPASAEAGNILKTESRAKLLKLGLSCSLKKISLDLTVKLYLQRHIHNILKIKFPSHTCKIEILV